DGNGADRRRPFGRAVAPRQLSHQALEYLLEAHADRRGLHPGHADVGDVGGTFVEGLIGRLDVRVGADKGGYAAGDVVQHHLLLAGRFGVELDERRHPGGDALERFVDGAERIVERVHEDAPHHLDHRQTTGSAGVEDVRTESGRARRVVGWTQEPRRLLHHLECLGLIETVVAKRDDIGAGIAEVLEVLAGEAEAARGVLAVDYRQVVGRSFTLQVGRRGTQAGGTEDVAD